MGRGEGEGAVELFWYLSILQDVVNSLQEKLNLKCVQHFNLVLHNVKSHMPGRMTLLQEHETVAEVRNCLPCHSRMTLLLEHETVAEVIISLVTVEKII